MDRFGSSAGSEGAPVEGQGARLFLDEPASVCFLLSELRGKAGSPFHAGRVGGCDSCEAKGGKPLKTNNSAKWPLSRLQ
jgi:hypothetical protein